MASTAADEDASDAYLRSCYNLLGDLASTYKSDLKPILLEPAIARLVTDGQKKGMTKSTKTALKYARAVCEFAPVRESTLIVLRSTGCQGCNCLDALMALPSTAPSIPFPDLGASSWSSLAFFLSIISSLFLCYQHNERY